MMNQIGLSLLLIAGISAIVFGVLIGYSDRFFKYWYKKTDFIERTSKYGMARYWVGSRAVLFGFGLLALYVLYQDDLAKKIYSLFI